MTSFKVGDVVQLNSGGPHMTVAAVVGDQVTTMWFEKGEKRDETFPAAMLRAPRPIAGPILVR